MNNVVKYDVYSDILLMMSIYVTIFMFQGKPQIPVILQTLSSGLRHRYAYLQLSQDDGPSQDDIILAMAKLFWQHDWAHAEFSQQNYIKSE